MNKTNMLTAHKVRLHGMTSEKWTTADKISQYKGLINLYTRDKTILDTENASENKKHIQDIKRLQTNIDVFRKTLDNYEKGDKQKLRNTLAAHRRIQLAYQNSSLQRSIDMVDQVNFTKRKTRDILRYRMKLKSSKLIELKLKCAKVEDDLKLYGQLPTLPTEVYAHELIGKVKDAMLRQEAAIHIRNCYKQIIQLMQKDAMYFDSILRTVHNDGLSQAHCLITATKLGQIGIESLDDRRREFAFLERIVSNDMQKRKEDLALVHRNLNHFSDCLKSLLRSESDNNLGVIKIENTESLVALYKEINAFDQTFTILTKTMFTSTDRIYPVLQEQLRQKERLILLKEKNETCWDDLLKKTEKAEVTFTTLKNTMVDTTTAYNITKVEMAQKINEQKQQARNYQTLIDKRYQLLAGVRISLKHLQCISMLLTSSPWSVNQLLRSSSVRKNTNDVGMLLPQENDASKMVIELIDIFSQLAKNSSVPEEPSETSYKAFEVFMCNRSKKTQSSRRKSSQDSYLATVAAAKVPTYEDVKKQSAAIVAEALAAREIKPPPPAKKKYKSLK